MKIDQFSHKILLVVLDVKCSTECIDNIALKRVVFRVRLEYVFSFKGKAHHRCEGQGAFFEKTNFRKIVLLSWKVASPKKIESGKWLSGK